MAHVSSLINNYPSISSFGFPIQSRTSGCLLIGSLAQRPLPSVRLLVRRAHVPETDRPAPKFKPCLSEEDGSAERPAPSHSNQVTSLHRELCIFIVCFYFFFKERTRAKRRSRVL